jgi:nicotinate-nucleotide adenylyltransferase
VHYGHLRLAIELRERLHLSQVRLVPCGRPPHREEPEVPAERRLEWVREAVADESGLCVDDREVRRAKPSYTYDTLLELRTEYPQAPIVLLLGDDAANQFHTWHEWHRIPDLAHLVFVERPFEPPAPSPQLSALMRGRRAVSASALLERPAGLWMAASIPPLAISSTRIRRLLAAGRSIRGLVPEAVIRHLTPEDVRALTRDEDPAHD